MTDTKEIIVHKPDQYDFPENSLPTTSSMCGEKLYYKDQGHWTQKWEKVTCKRCLVYKPKKD